jgi:hypothetical protein
MNNVIELTREVNFESDFDPRSLSFNDDLGFLAVAEADIAMGSLRLIGFAAPLSARGGTSTDKQVTPITDFNTLPKQNRTIAEQGKGVGPRLYNVRQAFGGAKSRPESIGVYSFDLDVSRILDAKVTQGSAVQRLARHAGRILRSQLSSTEQVVQSIHASYGTVDAVQLEVPPLPKLRQASHGVENPHGIVPQFMIIRNPAITLHRVGSTTAPW